MISPKAGTGGDMNWTNKGLRGLVAGSDHVSASEFLRYLDSSQRGELIAYQYEGFWRAMDTLRDRQVLEDMIERGDTPWQPNQNVSAAISA